MTVELFSLRKSGSSVFEEVNFQLDVIWEQGENKWVCSFIRKKRSRRDPSPLQGKEKLYFIFRPPSSPEYHSCLPPQNILFCLALFY